MIIKDATEARHLVKKTIEAVDLELFLKDVDARARLGYSSIIRQVAHNPEPHRLAMRSLGFEVKEIEDKFGKTVIKISW